MFSDAWEDKKREQFLYQQARRFDEAQKLAKERLGRLEADKVFYSEAYRDGKVALDEFKTGPKNAYTVKRDEYGLWEVSRSDGKPVPKAFSGKHTNARRAWDAIRQGSADA